MSAYLEPPESAETRERLSEERLPGERLSGERLSGSRMRGPMLDVGDLGSMLRRRLKLITTVALVGLMLGAVALLVLPPHYTATAILLVDPRQQRVTQSDAVLPGIGNDMGAVESQVELVQSTTLARKVIIELHLDQDPGFVGVSFFSRLVESVQTALGAPPANLMQRALSRFAQNLQVRRRGLTYVLEVGFVSKNSDQAARIANAVAEAYLASQVNVKLSATNEASGYLGSRLTELRKQANVADRAVADYKAENHLVDSGERRSIIEQQVADLNAQLTQAHVYASDVQSRYDQMRKASATQVAAGGLPEALQSQMILSLRTQYAQAEKTAVDLAQNLGSRHPAIKSAQAELAAARNQIAAELGRIAAGLRNQLAAARGRERALERSLSALKQDSAVNDQANVHLRELQREAEATQTVLQQFLVRFRETSEQQKLQVPDARIVSPASPPLRPSSPNPALVMALAAVASIAAGVGSAFLAERLVRRFRSVRETERLLELPVIGLVPHAGPLDTERPGGVRRAAWSKTGPSGDLARLALRRPLSLFGDALHNLAEQVRPADPDHAQTIVVTAAVAGEGTSTVAENLAHVIARSGPSTLLIDAATERPGSLAERAVDLLDWLNGGGSSKGLLERDAESGLYRLTHGRTVHARERAEPPGTDATVDAVFRQLAHRFDYVIIDGGAVLGTAGSSLLLPFADVGLLVVAWGETNQRSVTNALERVRSGADRLRGVVLNKVERGSIRLEEPTPARMVA